MTAPEQDEKPPRTHHPLCAGLSSRPQIPDKGVEGWKEDEEACLGAT